MAVVEDFYNFETTPIVPGYDNESEWNYAVVHNAWANNGVIEGPLFKTDTSGPLVVVSNTTYPIHECDILQVTAVLRFLVTSVEVIGVIIPPEEYQDDPFYGCALFETFDAKTGLIFSFIITNIAAYALYGWRPPPDKYPSVSEFTFVIPVFLRTSVGQFNTYQISFDKKNKIVNYRVNGDDRLIISRVGKRLDMAFSLEPVTIDYVLIEPDVYPECIQIRLGILLLELIYPASLGLCRGLFQFCDCNEDLYNVNRMACEYAYQIPFDYAIVVMSMLMESLGISRLFEIQPVCGCGPKEPPCNFVDGVPVNRPSSCTFNSTSTCPFGCHETEYVDSWKK